MKVAVKAQQVRPSVLPAHWFEPSGGDGVHCLLTDSGETFGGREWDSRLSAHKLVLCSYPLLRPSHGGAGDASNEVFPKIVKSGGYSPPHPMCGMERGAACMPQVWDRGATNGCWGAGLEPNGPRNGTVTTSSTPHLV